MSPNQTHDSSTHGSSHCCQAAATPPRSNTSDYLPLTQLPIPLLSDSAQNCGAFVPHDVFNQLSNALQNLTSSMQANNTPTPGNAESTHTIEGGTPSDESSLTVENSTPNVDDMDALSEASGQHSPGTSFGSTPIAVSTHVYCHTVLPGAHTDVSLPPVPQGQKRR